MAQAVVDEADVRAPALVADDGIELVSARLRVPEPAEVAVDTLKRAKDLDKKASIRDALAATKLDTIVGPVAWGSGPVKNVAKTPLVGGQWVKGSKYKYDLVIVNNQTAPNIPTAGTLKLMGA